MLNALLVPTVVAAIAVFIASSIVNAVLPWHKSDFKRLPEEDKVRGALKPMAIQPGEYMIPRVMERAELKSPEYLKKVNEGPVMIMTVWPNGPINMGKALGSWFVYCLIVSAFTGMMAHAAVGTDAEMHSVFHFSAIAAFMCYVIGTWQSSIWYGRPWSTALKSTIDGIIYALITAAIFVWLWP